MIIKQKKIQSIKEFILIMMTMALCLLVIERYQLHNGFTMVLGDRSDAIIMAVILEHWYRVFCGLDNWSYVNYFFPYTKTIAQTDGYFLLGAFYAPFRALGLDPFLAMALVNPVVKSVGFISMYLLARRRFSFTFYWALLIAILFTLSNGMNVYGVRLQLATVAFAPLLAMLVWGAIRSFWESDVSQFRLQGAFSGLLFGAWCLTCFYMAWFFLFFLSIFLLVLLALSGKENWIKLKNRFLDNYGSVIFVMGIAFIALLPFISVYLPKSLEVGVRSYGELRRFMLSWPGILQVGADNFMWGSFYNSILSYIPHASNSDYNDTGFPFIVFFLFVCGCAYNLKFRIKTEMALVYSALIVSTIVTWLLSLKFFGHSGWYFVYHLFPGAKALRVVATYQFFLAFPVIIIAIHYLSTQRIVFPMVFLLCILMVVEQLNSHSSLGLNRNQELSRIALPKGLPPKACKVFYVSGWAEQTPDSSDALKMYAHNVTAMMIAETIGIPTINGIASFNLPDWNFGDPNNGDYDKRVLAYARKHNIMGLCKLDLNNKEWSLVKLNSE